MSYCKHKHQRVVYIRGITTNYSGRYWYRRLFLECIDCSRAKQVSPEVAARFNEKNRMPKGANGRKVSDD